jgi:hypothetical protein
MLLASLGLGGTMETQIQSYAFSTRSPTPVTLFGYASKSVPGLEINGLGKYGKTLKEKIIFLTRSRQLQVPLNRYVISSEYDLDTDPAVLRWLDLPVLMLYWYLAGHIRMGRLDNCMVVGNITPSGDVFGKVDRNLTQITRDSKWLLLGHPPEGIEVPCIDPKELLGHIPDLRFS